MALFLFFFFSMQTSCICINNSFALITQACWCVDQPQTNLDPSWLTLWALCILQPSTKQQEVQSQASGDSHARS